MIFHSYQLAYTLYSYQWTNKATNELPQSTATNELPQLLISFHSYKRAFIATEELTQLLFHSFQWTPTATKELIYRYQGASTPVHQLQQLPSSFNKPISLHSYQELLELPKNFHNYRWTFTITNELSQLPMSFHNYQWTFTTTNELLQLPINLHN